MPSNKDKVPFLESIEHKRRDLGMDLNSAIDKVQSDYDSFKNRNQRLLERQNDQANSAQVQLISHFALLATLSLTVIGFLITQTSQLLTKNQQILILLILALEIFSLFFGALDYVQTIFFHQKWAYLYQKIDKEVDEKFESGELQWAKDLNKIENKHLGEMHEKTKMWVTYVMIGLCLVGLLLMTILFIAYFFDVPGVR